VFAIEFRPSNCPFTIVIEDDDRVAYGYLLQDGKIVSDVWLYNCVDAPVRPDWRDRAEMPFLNASDYVNETAQIRFLAPEKISVQWQTDLAIQPHATVHYQNVLVAQIFPDVKPGCCRAAAKDGPLAKTLKS
jgi:hypothetical protein